MSKWAARCKILRVGKAGNILLLGVLYRKAESLLRLRPILLAITEGC
jgi:hypothetical protein